MMLPKTPFENQSVAKLNKVLQFLGLWIREGVERKRDRETGGKGREEGRKEKTKEGRKERRKISFRLLSLNLLSSPCRVLDCCILSCYFLHIADFTLSDSLVCHTACLSFTDGSYYAFYKSIYWCHFGYIKYIL